jgi:elongation factor P--(R)-beta-lysine ligase
MSPASRNDWRPTASLEILKIRARVLQDMRAFFAARNVGEVETPVLSASAVTDVNLHSFKTRFRAADLYLHTSPEFFMKRLLAAGSGDIYQICKVFRDDEDSKRHSPEFTLLEWYRAGFDQQQLMDEMTQLFQHLLQTFSQHLSVKPAIKISYQQAFLQAVNIDPLVATVTDLKARMQQQNIEIPSGMDNDVTAWLDWLMVAAVAPTFSKEQLTFIYDYPLAQAALARVSKTDARVAHRFEMYFGELELANGFHELTDAAEQRRRFEQDNQQRIKKGLKSMPVDDCFLDALAHGMPDCSGVAVGVDRLLMVLLNKTRIADVISFESAH